MEYKFQESNGRKISRPDNSKLLIRLIELQKLREQVRLAEVAMKPEQAASQVRQP